MQDPAYALRRMVVAVDCSSEHAEKCMKAAAGLTQGVPIEREIIVLTVIRNDAITDTEGKIDYHKLSQLENDVHAFHEKIVLGTAMFTFEKKIRSESIWSDDVAMAICGFCTKVEADLVIVGRRGQGFLKGLLLGSVSEKVVKNAPCSVFVVK